MLIILILASLMSLLITRLIFFLIIRDDLDSKINLRMFLKFHTIKLKNLKIADSIIVKYYLALIFSGVIAGLLVIAIDNILYANIGTLQLALLILFYLALALTLIYLSIYDILYFEIPLKIVYLQLAIVIIFNVIFAIFNILGRSNNYLGNLTNLIGGLVLAGIFYIIVRITREKAMGMGDVYLMLSVGLSVGLLNGVLAYLATLILASIFGLIYAAIKKDFKKTIIPLVPFISLGCLIALSLPVEIIRIVIPF